MMPVESALKQSKIRQLDLTEGVSVPPRTSVAEVIGLMKSESAACVLICENDRVTGIFTDRDVLTRVMEEPQDMGVPIESLMTPAPQTLRMDDSVADAIVRMHEGKFRHIPIVDEQGRALGLLDVQNLIQYLAEHFPDEVLNLPPRVHQKMTSPDGA